MTRFPTILLAVGVIVSAFAVIAPYVGAGAGEDFLLYRLAGIGRRQMAINGALIAALAVAWLFLSKLHVDRLAYRKRSDYARVLKRNPKLVLITIVSAFLVSVIAVIEAFDVFPPTFMPVSYHPGERAMRMKEHVPGISLVATPTDTYIARQTDTLEQRGYVFETDNNGFIKPSRIHDDPDLEVVFLGGSTTESLYVDPEKRFPYLAGRLLERKTGLKVNAYNGGQGGNHTMHANVLLLAKVIPMAPDYVVMMEVMNDFGTLSMYDGEYWNDNRHRSMVIPRYGDLKPRGSTAIDGLRIFVTRLLPDTSEMLKAAWRTLRKLSGREIEDPGAVDEWAAVRARRKSLDPGLEQRIYDKFKASLVTFVNLCRAWGIKPIFMTQANRITPTPDPIIAHALKEFLDSNRIDYQRYQRIQENMNNLVRTVAEAERVPLIDLHRLVPPTNKYMYDVMHFNNTGSAFVAEIIANQLAGIIGASDRTHGAAKQ